MKYEERVDRLARELIDSAPMATMPDEGDVEVFAKMIMASFPDNALDAIVIAPDSDRALLREAAGLLETLCECEPKDGCGRCDEIRAFLASPEIKALLEQKEGGK